MKTPGKAGAISRCKSGPGKAVAGRLEEIAAAETGRTMSIGNRANGSHHAQSD
jgi:hypothetical protein